LLRIRGDRASQRSSVHAGERENIQTVRLWALLVASSRAAGLRFINSTFSVSETAPGGFALGVRSVLDLVPHRPRPSASPVTALAALLHCACETERVEGPHEPCSGRIHEGNARRRQCHNSEKGGSQLTSSTPSDGSPLATRPSRCRSRASPFSRISGALLRCQQ
jgi:hypothetical protein